MTHSLHVALPTGTDYRQVVSGLATGLVYVQNQEVAFFDWYLEGRNDLEAFHLLCLTYLLVAGEISTAPSKVANIIRAAHPDDLRIPALERFGTYNRPGCTKLQNVSAFLDFMMKKEGTSDLYTSHSGVEIVRSQSRAGLSPEIRGHKAVFRLSDEKFDLTFVVGEDVRAELVFKDSWGLILNDHPWDSVPRYSAPYAMFLALSQTKGALKAYRFRDVFQNVETCVRFAIPGDLHELLRSQQSLDFAKFSLPPEV